MIDTEPLFLESLTTLAYVAGLTTRIRLGTAVLCLPYRQPVIAAKQIANLDVLSGGRLILGIGVGARRERTTRTSRCSASPDPKSTTARTNTWPRCNHLDGGPTLIRGHIRQLPRDRDLSEANSTATPPTLIGGRGPRAIDLVVEFGNGWLPTWLSPDGYREHISRLREALVAGGRPDPTLSSAMRSWPVSRHTRGGAGHEPRPLDTLSSGFTVRSAEEALASALIGSPTKSWRRQPGWWRRRRALRAQVPISQPGPPRGTAPAFRDAVAEPLRATVSRRG